jgi:hypothetical protein
MQALQGHPEGKFFELHGQVKREGENLIAMNITLLPSELLDKEKDTKKVKP